LKQLIEDDDCPPEGGGSGGGRGGRLKKDRTLNKLLERSKQVDFQVKGNIYVLINLLQFCWTVRI